MEHSYKGKQRWSEGGIGHSIRRDKFVQDVKTNFSSGVTESVVRRSSNSQLTRQWRDRWCDRSYAARSRPTTRTWTIDPEGIRRGGQRPNSKIFFQIRSLSCTTFRPAQGILAGTRGDTGTTTTDGIVLFELVKIYDER